MRPTHGRGLGIGFISGGAILEHGAHVRGLASGASIGNTGAIGAAVAFASCETVLVLDSLDFMSSGLLMPLKENVEGGGDGRGGAVPRRQA